MKSYFYKICEYKTYPKNIWYQVIHRSRSARADTRLFCGIIFVSVNENITEAVAQRCSLKKVFLEICKIHRKTPVSESLF